MQRRYVASEYATLPIHSGRYKVALEGYVRDTNKGIVPSIKLECGQSFVFMDLWDGLKDYPLALVMAFAFKPHSLPEKHWNKLTVGFVDGDQTNVHPSNLVWIYPENGIEHDTMPGFKYVPGFTRYVINAEGDLFCIQKDRFMTAVKATNGYMDYRRLKPDIGDKDYCTGRHRLVGLAWLKYPPQVDKLQVNHINTIPGDDWLDNLEWTTQIENMQHAKKHELLTICKPTLVRNVRTGEVTRYPSILDVTRATGVHHQTLRDRLKKVGQPVYPGDLQFKYEDDPTPWREVTETETPIMKGTQQITLKAFDIKLGVVTIFKGISAAARELGLDGARIWHCLNTPRLYNKIVKGYVFHFVNDESPWPII